MSYRVHQASPMRRNEGVTLVELLVGALVLTVVLAVAGAFLSQQSRVSIRTQARSEAEIASRTIVEYVAQDLQVSGSRVVISSDEAVSVPIGCGASETTFCVQSTDNGVEDVVDIIYATSIDPTVQCRYVQYSLVDDTMFRSDVLCGETPDPEQLAAGITAFDVSWLCSDSIVEPTANACYKDSNSDGDVDVFPRQATIRIDSRSNDREAVPAEMRLTTKMPNLRN